MDHINVLEKSLISTGGRGLEVGRGHVGERGMYDIKQYWQGRGQSQQVGVWRQRWGGRGGSSGWLHTGIYLRVPECQ